MPRTTHRSPASHLLRATAVGVVSMPMLAPTVQGQIATLVRDVNLAPALPRSSYPIAPFELGGAMFFFAGTPEFGTELYRSDGTPGGTVRLGDFEPGNGGLSPRRIESGYVHVSGNRGWFFRNDPLLEAELWTTDGTAAGTMLVKIVSGTGSANLSNTWGLAANGRFYFAADFGSYYGFWVSDGTAAGTVELLQRPADTPSFRQLAQIGNDVLFRWSDPQSGVELWKSDGTVAGTSRLLDLRSGPVGAEPNGLFAWSNQVLFSANDGTNGTELWITDATAAGTRMLDLVPGSGSSSPTSFRAFGNRVCFSATDPTNGRELWITDGTTAGTSLLNDIRSGTPGSNAIPLDAIGSRMVFYANDGTNGGELWATDGTPTGAVLLGDLAPGSASLFLGSRASTGTRLVFIAPATLPGWVYATDGTPAGTGPVRRFVDPPGTSTLECLGPSFGGGQVLLRADDGAFGAEPWLTDGTIAGTSLFVDIAADPPGATADALTFFSINVGDPLIVNLDDGVLGSEPWTTDGTAAGTANVADLVPGSGGSFPQDSMAFGRQTLFIANDGIHGREPWMSDGTAAGTRLVLDIWPGPSSSVFAYGSRVRLRDRVLFFANDGVNGNELWSTDGTTAGTFLVRDLAPTNLLRFGFVRAGEQVFLGTDSQLWKTDGTTAGTVPIPFPGFSVLPGVAFGDRMLFQATDASRGAELWSTDGTTAGTVLVRDIEPGPTGSSPFGFKEWNGRVWFTAITTASGIELWSSDGTAGGTSLVADIAAGPAHSNPRDLTPTAAGLYFTAENSTSGRELHRVTVAGTHELVADLWPGPRSADPGGLYSSGSRYLWFQASEPSRGAELWRTDGSTAGTIPIAEIWPGPASASPFVNGPVGSSLLLAATDGTTGFELWTIPPGASLHRVGIPCGNGFHEPDLDGTDPVLGRIMALNLRRTTPTSIGLLLFGLPGRAVPIGNGCDLNVDSPSILSVFATDGTGSWSSALLIPPVPILAGIRVAFQAAVAPSSGPATLETTPALIATLGN